MKTGVPAFVRRSLSLAAVGVLAVALGACTGRGGGNLAPGVGFTEPATFGFSFSCERSSRSANPNPPTGQLRIQLSYTDHGTNPIGSWFSIHGIVDRIDPVLESMVCSGQEPPTSESPNELIFLGRYRVTSPPAQFPTACRASETQTTWLCRFEVIVRDNDLNRAPSKGDFFSIKLSTVTDSDVSEFPDGTVFYTRAGLLEGGNLTAN